MGKKPIYTIGYGNRELHEFLNTLKVFGIQYLIDVRSSPYSKFNPKFNQNELKHSLLQEGVTYVFMGDNLGGRPSDDSCYNDEGKVDYDRVMTKDFFKKGIERLKTAYYKDISVVIMCSEIKPSECHRSKLIGRFLFGENISVSHIDDKNNLKTQVDIINELNKGLSDITLFADYKINTTSRKSYP